MTAAPSLVTVALLVGAVLPFVPVAGRVARIAASESEQASTTASPPTTR